MIEFGKLLPGDFIPQFRDTLPTIKLEGGGGKEYELPEIDFEDDEEVQESARPNVE